MSPPSSDCEYFPPLTSNCDLNGASVGRCVVGTAPTGGNLSTGPYGDVDALPHCECGEYYTGNSDFVNLQGRGCQVFLPLVWALWSLNLLSIALAASLAAPILARLVKHHNEIRARLRAKSKPYSIKKNLGLLSILPFWLIYLPVHLALCIYKLSERDARLGLDLTLTLGWAIAWAARHLAVASYTASLTTTTLETRGMARSRVFRAEMSIVAQLAFAVGLTCVIWPVFASYQSHGVDDDSIGTAMACLIVYCLGSAVLFTWYAVNGHRLSKEVNNALSESYQRMNDKRILAVRDTILRYLYSKRNRDLLRGSVFFLYGVIPPLYGMFDYLFPLMFLFAPVDGFSAAQTIDRGRMHIQNNNNSKQRAEAGEGDDDDKNRRSSSRRSKNFTPFKSSGAFVNTPSFSFRNAFGTSSGARRVESGSGEPVAGEKQQVSAPMWPAL